MALSASHTRRTEDAVQSPLAERQRREAQKRKEIEEKERKDRELEVKLYLKRFEEQKREQELAERLERERQAKKREMQRRQEQERDASLYGRPKKVRDKNGYRVFGRPPGRGVSSSSDDDEPGPSTVLTREEKRQQALERELGIYKGSGKRTVDGSAYRKPGRRLPGGAVDSGISQTFCQGPPGMTSSQKSSPGSSRSTSSARAPRPPPLRVHAIHLRRPRHGHPAPTRRRALPRPAPEARAGGRYGRVYGRVHGGDGRRIPEVVDSARGLRDGSGVQVPGRLLRAVPALQRRHPEHGSSRAERVHQRGKRAPALGPQNTVLGRGLGWSRCSCRASARRKASRTRQRTSGYTLLTRRSSSSTAAARRRSTRSVRRVSVLPAFIERCVHADWVVAELRCDEFDLRPRR